MREGSAQFLKLLLWLVAAMGIVCAVLYFFYVELVTVGHDGMAPTMTSGDVVVVWKGSTPEMGDVVFCANPQEPGQYVLSRVVARSGRTIATTRHGNLMVAGTTIDHDYDGHTTFTTSDGETISVRYGRIKMGSTTHRFLQRDGQMANIPEQQVRRGVFLLGDNRTAPEYDSRSFGVVSPSSCYGSVFLRLSPSGRAPAEFENSYLDYIY